MTSTRNFDELRQQLAAKQKARKREAAIVIALAVGFGAAILAAVAGLLAWATGAVHNEIPSVPDLSYVGALALIILLTIAAQVLGMFVKAFRK